MSLLLSLILNFCSALSWIMLVHYIDKIAEKHSNEARRARKKIVYRIVSAVVITIVNHLMYLLATATLKKPVSLQSYYAFGLVTFWKIFKVLLVNSILFFGNWMCLNSHNYESLKDRFMDMDLEFWKSIVIAPFLEEMLFTAITHWSFQAFQYQNGGSSSPVLYVLTNSLIFSLAHLHMKWDEISIIWSGLKEHKADGLISKLIRSARVSVNLLIITFIYKLYTNMVVTRVQNFWPCFLLHAYCNLMGGPSLNYWSKRTLTKMKLLDAAREGGQTIDRYASMEVRESAVNDQYTIGKIHVACICVSLITGWLIL